MNKNSEKLISVIKEMRMTESEKAVVRHNISFFIKHNSSAISEKKYRPAHASPYFSRLSFPWMKTVALALVVMIAGGGSLAYASADSLPGDFLYNAKINFTEELVAATKMTPETRIKYQEARVEKRLNEVDAMLKNGTMTENRRALAEAVLQKQLDALSQKMESLPENKKAAIVLKTASTLTPSLQAHGEAMRQLSIKSKNADAIISRIENGIRTMSEKEDAELARTDGESDHNLSVLAQSNISIAQSRVNEVNSLLPDTASSPGKDMAALANAKIAELNSLLAQSKEKIHSGDYKEALRLSQQAYKMAEKIQLKINLRKNLGVSVDENAEIKALSNKNMRDRINSLEEILKKN